jgi:RNA polymerase sigma-70 factor, ECF subfamily
LSDRVLPVHHAIDENARVWAKGANVTEAIYEPDLAPAGVTRALSAARDEAFARFYERWHAALLGYSRRHFGPRDAEEITQEAFARAYELLDLTRESRRQWSWLTVVARNIAADLGRHRRVCDVLREEEPVYAPAPMAEDLEQPLLDEECLQVLRLALTDLPQSQSRAWWLTIAEGMTPQAIALSLACSPVSVRQALFKSRRRLALALGDYCERARALALPALLVLRRFVGHARRHVGRTAANAGLGATLASSALVGAIAVLVQSIPAPVASPALDVAAASRPVRTTTDLPAARARLLAARARAGTVGHKDQLPAKTSVYVAKKPLAPGTQFQGVVDVVTPMGSFEHTTELWRGQGSGLICNRTSVVQCH